MNNFRMLSLFAETFIHAGSGVADGGVDLPVTREATTGFPYIAGSSLKGALRHAALRLWGKPTTGDGDVLEVSIPFGKGGAGYDGHAGALLVGDARLLLLPVRSLDGAFRYCTSRQILARLARDRARVMRLRDDDGAVKSDGRVPEDPLMVALKELSITVGRPLTLTGGPVHVEDVAFDTVATAGLASVVDGLTPFMPDDGFYGGELGSRLVVMHDDDFAWFCRNSLPVRMRNALDESTKTTRNGQLWYEEYLPPETVLTVVIGQRSHFKAADFESALAATEKNGAAKSLRPVETHPRNEFADLIDPIIGAGAKASETPGYLQVGGNETVGHGWFSIREVKP